MAARTCGPRASDGWPATGSLAVRVASLGDHVHPIVFSSPVEGSSIRCTHAVLLASTMVRSARCGGRGPSRPEAVCAPCTGPLSPTTHSRLGKRCLSALLLTTRTLCRHCVAWAVNRPISPGSSGLYYTVICYHTTRPHGAYPPDTPRDEMEIQYEQERASLPTGTTAFITELLSSMSHELRSPLASIKAYATTLLRRDQRLSRAQRQEFLLAIDQASDRLAVVIEHLLEMAQLETGTLLLERSAGNLGPLAREAIADVKRLQGASGYLNTTTASGQHRGELRLRLEGRGGVPGPEELFIQADRHQLRRVLDHLLENAINYSPEGGTIEVVLRPLPMSAHRERSDVSLHQDDDGGDGQTTGTPPMLTGDQELVEISVRDHGMAIPAEHLAQVFEPFYRVDTRLSREVNGLGIGLAICKRIVELHGGRIWVESMVGAGSTFHVWLPKEGSMSSQLQRRDTHASEQDHDSRGR